MGSIESTWVAYAFEREAELEQIEWRLHRVGAHYGELFAEPLTACQSSTGSLGMALWHRVDERLRVPMWCQENGLAVAATNAPTGSERLVEGAQDLLSVGLALRDHPDRLVDLNPPFVIALHDADGGTMTIVNDFLGAGRLYELRTDEGWVWSNRLGALPLFAGVRPEADDTGWALLAATGWFLGSATPMRGAHKVAPGSAVVARAERFGTRVETRQTEAVHELVVPRKVRLGDSAATAADQAVELAGSIGRLWSVPPIVNLSGGRDSRISAAGAIVAGIEAEYRTMDIEPGEVDTVRRLISAAPGPISHTIEAPEQGEPPDDLHQRIGAKHLVHDGLGNPMSALRGPTNLPRRGFSRPLVTGHGGELGHGFYYDRSSVRALRRKGRRGIVRRLERTGRQAHSAAQDEAYGVFEDEVQRTIQEARSHGIEGPSLLDYYYLAQRLPFRAGLGTRNDRYSACATPAFVRAAFDLTPRQRVRTALHRAVLRRLIPQWGRIPFFHGGGGRLAQVNRDRIWEKPRHSQEIEAMLERRSLWGDLFVPERVHRIWAEVRGGAGGGTLTTKPSCSASRGGFATRTIST
jgi:hypothetical protein